MIINHVFYCISIMCSIANQSCIALYIMYCTVYQSGFGIAYQSSVAVYINHVLHYINHVLLYIQPCVICCISIMFLYFISIIYCIVYQPCDALYIYRVLRCISIVCSAVYQSSIAFYINHVLHWISIMCCTVHTTYSKHTSRSLNSNLLKSF